MVSCADGITQIDVNPDANPDFDMQTFDNLFQAITMAKETYL